MGDNLDQWTCGTCGAWWTAGHICPPKPTTGTESTTLRVAVRSGAAVLVGISECCKCEQPTEELVLCVCCGSVKR